MNKEERETSGNEIVVNEWPLWAQEPLSYWDL